MSRSLPPAAAPLRHRPVGVAAGALMLLALLGGCSGTRFGEALSRSFSSGGSASGPGSSAAPAAAPAPAAPAAPGQAGVSPGASRPTNSPSSAPANSPGTVGASALDGKPVNSQAGPAPAASGSRPANGTNTGQASATPGASTGRTATAPRPAPYRVTILLPQADAAAPAEVVTQALRAAGVPFEVETIERLGRNTTPQAPVSRPAPEPR